MLTVTDDQIRQMMENRRTATAERIVLAIERDCPAVLQPVPHAMRPLVAAAAVDLAAENGIGQDADIVRLLAGLLGEAGPAGEGG